MSTQSRTTSPTGQTPRVETEEPVRTTAYDELRALLREAAVLGSVESLLGWDQEAIMPAAGAALRADQLASISALAHEKRTHKRIGELIGECESDPAVAKHPLEGVNLREMRRDYERSRKLPAELVAELARTSSKAMDAWKDARAKSDFKAFAPWLKKTVELQRRKAECYGPPKSADGAPTTLYDALMEDFEPGMTSAQVEVLFKPLRERLTALIAQVTPNRAPDDAVLKVKVPIERQVEFNRRVAAALGFDFSGGRLDVSTHPFSESVGPGDTRMTTRYRDDHFAEACLTTMHETGHSVYEQGLPKGTRFGEPLGRYISLGIHESQSRMLENFVGRSRAFWEWATPLAKSVFNSADLNKFAAEDVFRAVNAVKPHFIRVESDEATYNLHIMLRFDVERAMLAGDLPIDDLPGVWNERMKKDLGLTVAEDRLGCLQDVHWSMGAIGYFPTYTLGNLYCGQMWERIRKDVPDLDGQMSRGDFGALLGWLREHVHAVGRRFTAPELCQRITGAPLSHEPLMRHLEGKLRPLYGV